MDTFKNSQYIAYMFYGNLHEFISISEILKHVLEHNTRNITHTLSHLRVQVVT